MMTARKLAGNVSALQNQREEQIIHLQNITALPQHVLELILTLGTSAEDEKSLRQTCQIILQVLDESLTCINLANWQQDGWEDLVTFEKRLQHVRCLTTVSLRVCHGVPSLLRILPCQLTTVNIRTYLAKWKHDHTNTASLELDLKELGSLKCLTTLYLDSLAGTVKGMEHVSGLTRLRCNNSLGPLAHLAPTLKHLIIWDYNGVPDMNTLTNLETLGVRYGTPANFFEVNGHLPLKHLCPTTPGEIKEDFYDAKAWNSAPPSLTGLRLRNTSKMPLGMLSTTITYLQLLYPWAEDIIQAVTLLPGLRCLDLYLVEYWYDNWNSGLECLSKLTSLQSLGVLVEDTRSRERKCWDRNPVLNKMPDIAMAVARGVKLNILSNSSYFMDLLPVPSPVKTAWITPAWAGHVDGLAIPHKTGELQFG